VEEWLQKRDIVIWVLINKGDYIMKISTKTRYGLRALIYIAENASRNNEKLVRIKEISEAQNLSVQYLEQILFKLKKII
jgi:DNA-binding IscR family transcriptional regulator